MTFLPLMTCCIMTSRGPLLLRRCFKRGFGDHRKQPFNSLRPRQNGLHFPDDIFKCIFLNESTSICISIEISLKFVPKGPINNIPALVQIMAWRRPGDKPLSETMLVCLLTHICVTRPQWVNKFNWIVISIEIHSAAENAKSWLA